jgi:putative FmdB family regulatory protein
MPIVRTYGCEDCGHFTEVWLTLEQCDDPPPPCPHCAARAMQQEFKPVALVGTSPSSRANALMEDIVEKDYGVADLKRDHRADSTPKVRYKDQGTPGQASTWGAAGAMIQTAVAIGRQTRMDNGGYSGVDTLQAMLKSGAQPDLIEASRRRAIKVW